MSIWKNSLEKLNKCLEKNNFPRLRILTDSKNNVVYLDKFRQVSNMFLEFCEKQDVKELYKDIYNINRDPEDNMSNIRYSIITYIVKLIPLKIVN